jgi:hypothetical protein
MKIGDQGASSSPNLWSRQPPSGAANLACDVRYMLFRWAACPIDRNGVSGCAGVIEGNRLSLRGQAVCRQNGRCDGLDKCAGQAKPHHLNLALQW